MTPAIPAKPTRYKGINFASKLEAYWDHAGQCLVDVQRAPGGRQ